MLNARALAGSTAMVLLLTLRAAVADTLITGVIRDRAGAAVAGARVTALDAAGHAAGGDLAAADGTFAIGAPGDPRAIEVTCDFCRPVRQAIVTGEPAVIVLDRYPALTASGPTAADIRALPYRSAADAASLRPFAVVDGALISDRGLDHTAAVLVDGLPFYRVADGADAAGLVPAHALAGLNAASPLAAPQYGGYADAGIVDLRLHDADLSTSRFDLGDASDIVGRWTAAGIGAGYAASSDDGANRQAASVDAALPFAGGRLTFDALELRDDVSHAGGAGLAYATDSRRFQTVAALTATQFAGSSLVSATAHVRSRGPAEWEIGARAARATAGVASGSGQQFDTAFYAAGRRDIGQATVAATVALDRGSDAYGAVGARATAALGSLGAEVKLDPHWSAHVGAVSNLRLPTFAELAPGTAAGDRSLLAEASLTFADLRRLRVTQTAYAQRTTNAATNRVYGLGLDAAWQIAPRLSLRSWILRANQTFVADYPAPGPDPGYVPAAGAPLSRRLIWLSYEGAVRIDALVRGGKLEGGIRIPFDALDAFTLGSAQYDGRRVTTFGITRR